MLLVFVVAVVVSAFVVPVCSIRPVNVRIEHQSLDDHRDLIVDSRQPHISWQIDNEYELGALIRNVRQRAYRFTVQSIRHTKTSLYYDSGIVPSDQTTYVQYTGPSSLQRDSAYSFTLQYWSTTGAVSEKLTGHFRTSMFDEMRSAIPDIVFIGSENIVMNQLRKEFVVPDALITATIYSSGVGYSSLYVNGQRADPSRRNDPGWTTYEKRTFYVSLDVTNMLTSGQPAAIGVELGNGWYSQEQFWSNYPEPTYGTAKFFCVLVLHTNTTSISITTDATWLGRTGPRLHDGLYMGTIYDARLRRDGWAKPGFTDPYSLWINASILPSPADGIFSLQPMDPVRIGPDALHIKTSAARLGGRGQPDDVNGGSLMDGGILRPIGIVGSGGYQIFDFGQNFAGFCAFNVTGPRGIALHLRHAEIVTPGFGDFQGYAGGLFVENLRQASSTDIYILEGTTPYESYEAEMTSHGFRYVSLTGYNLGADQIECYRAHSETSLIGNFTSSNTIINQIHHNVQWGQLSNSLSLPSDCPQRDERKGWLGDAGLSVDESLFNFDYMNFYANFLDLMHDIQGDDGSLTDTVPFIAGNRPADPNWGAAYMQIIYYLYDHYADVAVIHRHFDGVRAWVEYVRGRYSSGGGLASLYAYYGDWQPPQPYPRSTLSLVSAYAFLRDVSHLAQLSSVIGNQTLANEYTWLYNNLTAEWHKTWYVESQGGYADNMQTSNILSLHLPGIVPDKLRQTVLNTLTSDIQAKGHTTSGVVGISALFPVLSMNGLQDIAVSLLTNTSYPSYGYMFTNPFENATTLWEIWNAPTAGADYTSRNHHMYATIGSWFYRYLAGIHINAFEDIEIHPILPSNMKLLKHVNAEVICMKGSILVDWKRDDDGVSVTYQTTVPHNTFARIAFEPFAPGSRVAFISEMSVPIFTREIGVIDAAVKNQHVQWLVEDTETGIMMARVGGGSYVWSVVWEIPNTRLDEVSNTVISQSI